MRLRDAIAMLAPSGVGALGPTTWADLGSGDGTFTRALAELLAAGSVIHAMDLDGAALRSLRPPAAPASHAARAVRIATHRGDFTRQPWPFGDLDGILMANSLHYVRDQVAFLRDCGARMSPPGGGRFLIVEYDLDLRGANQWVPYPLSRSRLSDVFTAAGYASISFLGSRPSVYQRAALYAALVEP